MGTTWLIGNKAGDTILGEFGTYKKAVEFCKKQTEDDRRRALTSQLRKGLYLYKGPFTWGETSLELYIGREAEMNEAGFAVAISVWKEKVHKKNVHT